MLTANNPNKDIVTMNAVNGGSNDYFSSDSIISDADTDFAFSELWGNSDTYKKVYFFVKKPSFDDSHSLAEKAPDFNTFSGNF